MKKLAVMFFILILTMMTVVSASAKNVLYGDMNGDSRITASDARVVLRASAGLELLTDEQRIVADVDNDGKINASDARMVLRCAAGLENDLGSVEIEEVYYLNELMDDSDKMEVFVASCQKKKQDGFVFKYKQQIVIHDGGQKLENDGTTYNYLYELRKSLLPDGVSEDDENYKLKLTLVISHFHTDHVNSLIYTIVPSPYFEIETVYMPEQSVFENTTYYSDPEYCDTFYYADGGITKKGRLAFLATLSEFSPDARVICVGFGETAQFTSDDGQVVFDMFAPSQDWGTQESAKKLLDIYYNGGASSSTTEDFPKAVVNSNSMWLKVTYGDRSMLFTGDVMKKSVYTYNSASENYVGEPFDLMLSYYAEKCGEDVFDVDVVKFPHHGQVRPKASKGVFEVLTPSLVLCTADNYKATTVEAAKEFWDSYTGSYCLSDNSGLYIHTDGKDLTVTKNGTTAEIYTPDGKLTDISGEILDISNQY